MNDYWAILVIEGSKESFLRQCADPQVWMPVVVALVGFLVGSWIRMILSRKEVSRRAVTYLTEIAEEVEIGVELLHYWYDHGGVAKSYCGHTPRMTKEAWRGFSSIVPDDVYQRILNVAHRTGKSNMRGLRSHLKNYYVCICGHYERVINNQIPFNAGYFRNDIDGADMVKQLVDECKDMMEKNSRRWFWPW